MRCHGVSERGEGCIFARGMRVLHGHTPPLHGHPNGRRRRRRREETRRDAKGAEESASPDVRGALCVRGDAPAEWMLPLRTESVREDALACGSESRAGLHRMREL